MFHVNKNKGEGSSTFFNRRDFQLLIPDHVKRMTDNYLKNDKERQIARFFYKNNFYEQEAEIWQKPKNKLRTT